MTTLLESMPEDKLCDAVKALSDAGVLNMAKDGYMILKKQVKERQEKTAIALLALKTSDGTPIIDPSQDDNAVFYWAVTNNMLNLVNTLLEDPRVHPDTQCSEETGRPVSPIGSAAYEGHVEVVRRLLDDARVQPRGFSNAAKNKHWDILDMLLATGKGDASFYHNKALRGAVWANQQSIVNRLLSYEKVDPNDYPAGKLSAVEMALSPNTSLNMAKLILEDRRAEYTGEDLRKAQEDNTDDEAKFEYLVALYAKPNPAVVVESPKTAIVQPPTTAVQRIAKYEYLLSLLRAKPKPVDTIVEDPKPLAVVQPSAVQRIEVHVYVHTDQKQQQS